MDTYENKYKEANDKVAARFGTNVAKEIFADLYESEDEKMMHQLHSWMKEFGGAEEYTEKVYTWLKSLLEKQCEQSRKVSIWKHWKDGIAGNGEGKLIYLIKNGDDYRLSSCLGFECDYIELSELDKLMQEEKQGEQKPIDKVEPKFKNGQWIVWRDKCYKVNYNGCGYELVDQDGLSTSLEYGTIDENAHIWDVTTDAKAGDVLASELCDSIILFKGIKDYNIDFYCDYDFSEIDIPGDRFSVNNGQHYGNIEDSKDFHPSTKEQRDLLFQKIKDAGYKWDEGKKELRKIEKKPQRMISAEAKEAMYDKPTDNDMVETLRTEYEKGRADAIAEMQKKWSEEDEEMLTEIITDVKFAQERNPQSQMNQIIFEEETNWLKSLKERYTWKPSDEQTETLELIINSHSLDAYHLGIVQHLYNDLKKLKGE